MWPQSRWFSGMAFSGMAYMRVGALVVATAYGLAPANRAWGDDFHVQSKIFFPGEKKPSESTTLFYAGRVYDFLSDPEETTVFDPGNDVFKLVDPRRKLKTEITTGEISKKINLLRAGPYLSCVPDALIQVFEVRLPEGSTAATPVVTPSATARTALPPDTQLSLPSPADLAHLPPARPSR